MVNTIRFWEKALQKLYKTGAKSQSAGGVAAGILPEWPAI